MTEGTQVIAEYFDGRPIAVDLPKTATVEVVETSPVMRGATKTASNKPAKLANGVTVNVPEFIQIGEKIRVNPNTLEYLDRAKD
jgi:elongation factor P